MKHSNALINAISWTGCCCSLLFSVCGWPQDSEATRMEKSGREAFEARQYQQALELYSEGAARAEEPAVKARLDFRQAVTLQQMAGAATTEESVRQLQQAARLYHVYLEQNPGSTATANNLAKTYETLGLSAMQAGNTERASAFFKRADGYFQKAIGADDASQGLYVKNYADFLQRTGQWERAKEIYARLVQEYPVSPALQQTLTDTYLEHGLDDLAEYLWNLQDAGYTGQSAEIALDVLQQTENENDRQRVELLNIVCAALAQGTASRDSFANSKTGRQVAALAVDSFIGKYADEIIILYRGDNFRPDNFKWWLLGEGRSSRDGFSALIRSLGSRAKMTGDLKLAEKYYLLAASLSSLEVDPVAIRDLVRMYAESNEFDKIDDVLKKYEVRLFASKAKGYANSDVEKVFQYHQTLGELYALIERWGDSGKADSAIFQLEHAQWASNLLADQTVGKLPETYRFTPQMVDQLSTGYERTGRVDKSLELRIDQAEIYNKAGDTKDAVRVLAPIQKADIPSTLPNRYRNQLEIYKRDGLIQLPNLDRDKVNPKNINNINNIKELKNIEDTNGN